MTNSQFAPRFFVGLLACLLIGTAIFFAALAWCDEPDERSVAIACAYIVSPPASIPGDTCLVRFYCGGNGMVQAVCRVNVVIDSVTADTLYAHKLNPRP